MPNARIMDDNIAERATLTASTTSGALAVTNLVNTKKSKVYRSASANPAVATITGVLTSTETASMVALPFCNLSQNATIRVRLYSDAAGATLVRDTGVVNACPAAPVKLRGFTVAQAAGAYANGGGAYARVYFTATNFMRFVIDISDASNAPGYVEAAFLVVASYTEVAINPDAVRVGYMDSTVIGYSRAGDQTSDAGTSRRQMSFDLSQMDAAERDKITDILRSSRAYPILVSIFPGDTDLDLERDYFIYGRRPKDADLDIEQCIRYSVAIPIEEV